MSLSHYIGLAMKRDATGGQRYIMVLRKFFIAAFLILAVILFGMFGYMLLEGWSAFDALYMTVITIATVGFSEVRQLDGSGRIFTILLIFLGIGVGGYAIGTIAAFLVEGQLLDILKGRRMAKEITGLKNHIIVCGFGKIGMEVCASMAMAGRDFIVIDTNVEKIDHALSLGYLAAVGEATDDEILEKCGIRQAYGLISAISDDSANVYLVLTARALNDKMRIIARGVGETTHKKMIRAGADRVVSPYEIGARRMAALMLKPEIVDFLEVLSPTNIFGLRLEKVIVKPKSFIAGKRLDESNIRRDTHGAMIVGVQKLDQTLMVNPPKWTILEADDVLLAIGSDEQLKSLTEMVD